jgi:hypothetical protein
MRRRQRGWPYPAQRERLEGREIGDGLTLRKSKEVTSAKVAIAAAKRFEARQRTKPPSRPQRPL